jgi:hypothetical protein
MSEIENCACGHLRSHHRSTVQLDFYLGCNHCQCSEFRERQSLAWPE